MTFFENQSRARKKTSFLVALYALSVITIILSCYLLISLLFEYKNHNFNLADFLWNPERLLAVGAPIFALVAGGTTYKRLQLNGGGMAVAAMLNGRLVNPQSIHSDEKRILNIVEEIAIASGTKVPLLYIMENEESICLLYTSDAADE